MSTYKQRTLDYLESEWGTYVERFNCWPKEEGLARVKAQGYEQFRDMLAHIVAWWEEAMNIILAIAEDRAYERKKYDFDVFNAEAVARYKDWDEGKFLAHFEAIRQKAAADLRSMNEAAWEQRRVRIWVDAVFIHHAREHLVALSRFLALDMLQNVWAEYPGELSQIEDKETFLKQQGVDSIHDMLVHIFGWWEVGLQITKGILADPGFTWTEPDTDAYNCELTQRYKAWTNEEVLKHYEDTRLAMLEMIQNLPEEAFTNPAIEDWLAADVVKHYDDHTIGG